MTERLFPVAKAHIVNQVPERSALEEEFPSAALSRVGRTESWRKEVHRPATSTHKWWAKRLGTVFRGIITAAVAGDEDEALSLYNSPTSLEGMVILDPFAGSGTTAVEGIKLGANVVSLDINPVATLVQRQAVQRWDIGTLNRTFKEVETACRSEIDRVHRTEDGRTVLYYFWVATANCEDCGDRVYLFDSTVYSRHAYPKRVPRAQLVCPVCLDIQEGRFDFERAVCENGHEFTQHGPVNRNTMVCSNGHASQIVRALGSQRPAFEMYAKMVVDEKGVKAYEPISGWDRRLYRECVDLIGSLPADAVLPFGELAEGNNTRQALRWNFAEWRDFFNARQLYSLSLLATAIRDVDAPAAEREALCTLFSGALEFNNRFTSFKGEGTGAVRHMFAHHVLRPERTPLEAHPWGTPFSSGSFSTLLKSRIHRADEYKHSPTDLVIQGDQVDRVAGLSRSLHVPLVQSWRDRPARGPWAYVGTCNSAHTDLPDGSVDLVISDPPYMDNVHYSELADFFHAWLRGMRPYEGYPSTASTRSPGEVQHADPVQFGEAIQAVWSECARVLKPEGLLAFTFHQARIAGWLELVKSLRASGLAITAVQPVKGEMTTSVVKAGAREPSNLDSVVICRKVAAVGEVFASEDDVFDHCVRRLTVLVDEGVDVGPGDVRSVVRGTMLSYLGPDRAHANTVDAFADRAIGMLL